MTAEIILPILNNRLWHTTPRDRFAEIIRSGAILPSPPIPNLNGWKLIGGDDYCPYAKNLGGVSLFDLNHFDPETYRQECPLSSWDEFIPYRSKWGGAVWIEIDRELISDHLISGTELVAMWNADEAYKNNFMPYIEAVHVGPLPSSAFKQAFLVRKDDTKIHQLRIRP